MNTDSLKPGAPAIRFSVVSPVFNEEALCRDLCEQLAVTIAQTGEPFEIIIVDDGSTDRTCEILREESQHRPYLRVVQLSRNFGQEAAICAGMSLATGEEVILIDGDLQDPPEVIPQLIAKKREGYNVVYGHKYGRKEGFFRRRLTQIFYFLMYFFSQARFPIDAGIFSIIDRRIAQLILGLTENNKHFSGLRAFVGFRQGHVSYERTQRMAGQGKSFLHLLRMGANAFFAFSIFPLRAMSFLLLFVVIWGLGIVGWGIISAATGTPGIGHLELFSVIATVVVALGVIILCEYIGRIHEQSKGRPHFIINSVIAHGLETPED